VRGDATKLLPALEEAVAPLLRDGRVWKLALDTYDREIGRYGGPRAIDAAEAIFEADSDAALAIVQLLESDEGDDERWRLALRGMHLLLCDLGFDLAARTGVLRTVRASFGAEHHVDVEVERQLGAKFRAERAALQLLLAAPDGTDHPLDAGFEVLAKRSHAIAPHVRALASAPLAISMPELAASLLHMHANRMLRAEHRAQELVLYDFLLRLYESEAARARRA
jgi:thiopeptide-type bacteriocin biosynthesis protein